MNRNRDRGLHDAASRNFDNWREALMAASVNLGNVSHRFSNPPQVWQLGQGSRESTVVDGKA